MKDINILRFCYTINASMHEMPSLRSISAILLKEKFVLPERIRLTYCGDTPSLFAMSERDSPFACI